MKTENASATAEVPDFSEGKDGSTKVEVPYSYEFNVLETDAELHQEFSPKDLLSLANQRLKSTANSGARQKAIAPYAQDPNSPAAIRESMIKLILKSKEGMTRDQAVAFVDSLNAA